MAFSSSGLVMVLVSGVSVAYVKRYRSPPAATLKSLGIDADCNSSRAGMLEIIETR